MQQRVVLVRSCTTYCCSLALTVRACLAQVNSFVIDTAHMLNRFATQAERTMERVDECVQPDRARLSCCAWLTPIAGSCRASRPRLRCWRPGLKGALHTVSWPRLQALTQKPVSRGCLQFRTRLPRQSLHPSCSIGAHSAAVAMRYPV